MGLGYKLPGPEDEGPEEGADEGADEAPPLADQIPRHGIHVAHHGPVLQQQRDLPPTERRKVGIVQFLCL